MTTLKSVVFFEAVDAIVKISTTFFQKLTDGGNLYTKLEMLNLSFFLFLFKQIAKEKDDIKFHDLQLKNSDNMLLFYLEQGFSTRSARVR